MMVWQIANLASARTSWFGERLVSIKVDQGDGRAPTPLVAASRQSSCTSVPWGRELQVSTGSIGKKT
jgi:hypothetical protein